jgi:hypothetical protein
MVHISFSSVLILLIYWAETYVYRKNTKALSESSKNFGIKLKAQKVKCMFMSLSPECGKKSQHEDSY